MGEHCLANENGKLGTGSREFNWQANFSSKMITHSQARQSCDESGTDKLHFLLEAWV